MSKIWNNFLTILLGQRLKIYTSHRILILILRVILEDFGIEIEYTQDKKDMTEEALSELSQ